MKTQPPIWLGHALIACGVAGLVAMLSPVAGIAIGILSIILIPYAK